VDSLEAGSQTVLKPLAVIQELGPIKALNRRIRDIFGENFLAHFDALIDDSRGLLCLDEAKLIEKYIRGERIPLVASKHPKTEVPFSERLVVSVNLSGTGLQPIQQGRKRLRR
jgi:hypothetical protein